MIFDVKFLDRSPGSWIASVSDDRSVRLWCDDQQVASLYGHTARIWRVRGFEGGLVSASEDATVRVWTAQGDKWVESSCLVNHIGKNVRALDVQGSIIVSGGEDSAIVVSELPSGEDV